jgi:polyhydroxybutyrate depolymerase
MTHAFAFNRADPVGAVATGAGSLPVTPKASGYTSGQSRPLPIMIVHGLGDTQMPWGGGCVADFGGNCNRGRVVSAEATRDRWIEKQFRKEKGYQHPCLLQAALRGNLSSLLAAA